MGRVPRGAAFAPWKTPDGGKKLQAPPPAAAAAASAVSRQAGSVVFFGGKRAAVLGAPKAKPEPAPAPAAAAAAAAQRGPLVHSFPRLAMRRFFSVHGLKKWHAASSTRRHRRRQIGRPLDRPRWTEEQLVVSRLSVVPKLTLLSPVL
ncbi:hypothetical protein DIPPA_05128 [Diplonema papillatum]|nr:hypothetical protein DIPPA_05128 [Diplonema papillatum]